MIWAGGKTVVMIVDHETPTRTKCHYTDNRAMPAMRDDARMFFEHGFAHEFNMSGTARAKFLAEEDDLTEVKIMKAAVRSHYTIAHEVVVPRGTEPDPTACMRVVMVRTVSTRISHGCCGC